MNTQEKIRYFLALETAGLAAVGIGIYTVEKPSSIYLYESLGALTATIITTFGLLRMSDLT